MKGIYKKLSVGVLAAALLVGAGGIAQGGQAFAASASHSECESYIHKKGNRNNDIGWVYGFYSQEGRKKAIERDKERDLGLLIKWQKGSGYFIQRQIGENAEKGVPVQGYFDDIFDLYSYADGCKHGNNKLKGMNRVKVGVFYYDVYFE